MKNRDTINKYLENLREISKKDNKYKKIYKNEKEKYKNVEYNFYDEGKFESKLGKEILDDMYNEHRAINYKFSKYLKGDNSNKTKINLQIELLKKKKELVFFQDLIDKRDKDNWHNEKLRIRYYKSSPKYEMESLKKLVSNKFIYGYEISQAWLKMYEILETYNLINKKLKKIETFHLCELPGNFIRATNFYIKTKTKIKDFDWLGQSLNPNYKHKNYKRVFGNSNFNLLKNYKNRWDFGKDNSGDITNIENIKYYKKKCKNIKFMTSDCGLGFPSYDEKALLNNKRVHIAEMIFMFNNLPVDSNFVCKFYIPIYYKLDIDIIYLLIISFNEVYFYKPLQNMTSSEFYIICKKYKGISKNRLNKLFKLLKNFNKNSFNKRIFKRNYSNNFKYQLININKKLINNVIFYIKRQFYYVDNKNKINKKHFDVFKKYSKIKNKQWIKKFNLKKINENDLL